jgi:large subunit ribosomal protein L15
LPFVRGKGFTPINRLRYYEVNLGQLGGFKSGSQVDPEALIEARLVKDTRSPIVLLGQGDVSVPLKVRIHRISKGAKEKIEAAGGSVEIINPQAREQGAKK